MHTIGWVLVKNYVSRSHEHTTTHCNTLQHTATQHTTTRTAFLAITNTLQHTATHCNTTHYIKDCFFSYHERTAAHCNTLQHTATQHTITHLILFAFITGNSHSELLLEGLLSQIRMDLSSWFSAGIEPWTYGQLYFPEVSCRNQLS